MRSLNSVTSQVVPLCFVHSVLDTGSHLARRLQDGGREHHESLTSKTTFKTDDPSLRIAIGPEAFLG
jgi:hypothetical protein